MSIADIILGTLILGGAYTGYKEGLIVSLFSLVALILALLGGFKLMGTIMVLLSGKYNIDAKVLPYIAFGLIFIIIVIGINLLGKLIKASIDKSFFGRVDQGAGALLGMVRATFMLSIVLWITDSLKVKFPEDWSTNSWLLPFTANFAPKIANWISGFFPLFRDVF